MAHDNGDLGRADSAEEEMEAIAAELSALTARLAHLEKPTITSHELGAVERRLAELEKSGLELGRMVLFTGVIALFVGAVLIGGTVVLGAEALSGTADVLSTGEFVAGVSAGCVLVLAVVALAATWISHSHPGRASL
jgi:hypothetical protein